MADHDPVAFWFSGFDFAENLPSELFGQITADKYGSPEELALLTRDFYAIEREHKYRGAIAYAVTTLSAAGFTEYLRILRNTDVGTKKLYQAMIDKGYDWLFCSLSNVKQAQFVRKFMHYNPESLAKRIRGFANEHTVGITKHAIKVASADQIVKIVFGILFNDSNRYSVRYHLDKLADDELTNLLAKLRRRQEKAVVRVVEYILAEKASAYVKRFIFDILFDRSNHEIIRYCLVNFDARDIPDGNLFEFGKLAAPAVNAEVAPLIKNGVFGYYIDEARKKAIFLK